MSSRFLAHTHYIFIQMDLSRLSRPILWPFCSLVNITVIHAHTVCGGEKISVCPHYMPKCRNISVHEIPRDFTVELESRKPRWNVIPPARMLAYSGMSAAAVHKHSHVQEEWWKAVTPIMRQNNKLLWAAWLFSESLISEVCKVERSLHYGPPALRRVWFSVNIPLAQS